MRAVKRDTEVKNEKKNEREISRSRKLIKWRLLFGWVGNNSWLITSYSSGVVSLFLCVHSPHAQHSRVLSGQNYPWRLCRLPGPGVVSLSLCVHSPQRGEVLSSYSRP